MEIDEKTMTRDESLRIITDMINKTRVNIRQSSFHLLFWGWLIFACSLSEFLLQRFTGFANPWYIWLFVIPGVFVSLIYGFMKGRGESVFTYATGIYAWTWMAFLVAAIVLFIIIWGRFELFSPLILTLAAVPAFISGAVLKFRPLMIGAVTFWLFALIARFGGQDISPLAVPLAMLTGYLIPGYLLRNKKDYGTV